MIINKAVRQRKGYSLQTQHYSQASIAVTCLATVNNYVGCIGTNRACQPRYIGLS